MSEDRVYKDRDIVWVKLGNNWWPGEVTDVHRQPEGLVKNLKKKPYCVVKFFQEDAYEYIKSSKQIFPFQCSKKEEFIKKGTALYNAKNKFMEKFPADVETAERLTRKTVQTTDLIIINDRPDSIVKAILGPTYTRQSNDYYDNNTCNTDYNNKRRSGDSITKILNITPQRTTLVPTIHTPDGAKTQPSPIIPLSNPTNAATPETNFYRCNLCNFSSQRQNVMILHRRTHSAAGGGNGACAGGGGFGVTPATLKTASATITTTNAPKASAHAIVVTAIKTTPAATTKRGNNKSPTTLIDNSTAHATKLDINNTTHLKSRRKSAPRSSAIPTCTVDATAATTLHHKLRSSLRIDADVGEITLPDRVPVASSPKDRLNMSMDDDTTDNSISEESRLMTCSPRKHNLDSAEDAAGSATQDPATNTAEEIRQRLLADWSDFEKDDELADRCGDEHAAAKTQSKVGRLSTDRTTCPFKQQDNMAYDILTPTNTAICNNGPHTSKQNRIRNIPKKDRRDAVLKEFISDFVPTTPAAVTPMDNSVNHNSSSSSIDSVVVVAVVPPNSGETIIIEDSINDDALCVNGGTAETKPAIASDAGEVLIETDLLDNHKVEVDIEAELQRAMQLEDSIETKIEPDIISYTPKLKHNRGRGSAGERTSNDLKSNFVSTCELIYDGDQNVSNVENKPHQPPPLDGDIKAEELSELTPANGRQKRLQRCSRRQRSAIEQIKTILPETITTKVEKEPSLAEPLEAPQVLPLSPQHIKEEERPQPSATAAAVQPQPHLITDCFDFQEDDSCSDTLKSIADFKKKYLSPDKVQQRTSQANNGVLAQSEPASERQRSTEKRDQQLALDIEMLLEQTADTIPAVVARTHSYGGSSKEDLSVKGLPIKERGKRIFKSRNRARNTTDDGSGSLIYALAAGLENVAAVAPRAKSPDYTELKAEEDSATVAEASELRDEQPQQHGSEESDNAKNAAECAESEISGIVGLSQVEQQLPQSIEEKEHQMTTAGVADVARNAENESERNEENLELHEPSVCSDESRFEVKTVNNGLLVTSKNVSPSQDSNEQQRSENVEINGGVLDVQQEDRDNSNLESNQVEGEEQGEENDFVCPVQFDEGIKYVNNSVELLNHYGNGLSAQETLRQQVDVDREPDYIENDEDGIEKAVEYIERAAEDIEKDVEGENIANETEYIDKEADNIERDTDNIDREPEDNEIVQGSIALETQITVEEPENIGMEAENVELEAESQQEIANDLRTKEEPEHNERVQGNIALETQITVEEPEHIEMEAESVELEQEIVKDLRTKDPVNLQRHAESQQERESELKEQEEISEQLNMVKDPEGINRETEVDKRKLENIEKETDDIERAPESQQESFEEIISMQADAEDNTVNENETHEEPEEEAADSEIENIYAASNQVHGVLLNAEQDTEASLHESPAELSAEQEQVPEQSLGATDEYLPADTALHNEDVADEQHELPSSRITSPTDDNSSVCISEAGAEFGSPTSMLDDERLPAVTGRLMTPTECLLETNTTDGSQGQNYAAHLLRERSSDLAVEEAAEEKFVEEAIEVVNENEKEINSELPVKGLYANDENAHKPNEVPKYTTHLLEAEKPVHDEKLVEDQTQNEPIYVPTEEVGGEDVYEQKPEQTEYSADEHEKEEIPQQPWEGLDENESEKIYEQRVEDKGEGGGENMSQLSAESNDEDMENPGKSTVENCMYEESEQAAAVGYERLGEVSGECNQNVRNEGIEEHGRTGAETETHSYEVYDMDNPITENEQADSAETVVAQTWRGGADTEMRNQAEFSYEDKEQSEVLREENEMSIQGEVLNEDTLSEGAVNGYRTKMHSEQLETLNQTQMLSEEAETPNQAETVAEDAEVRSEYESRSEEAEIRKQADLVGEVAEIQNQAKAVREGAEMRKPAEILFEGTDNNQQTEWLGEDTETQNHTEMLGEEAGFQNEDEVPNEPTPGENVESQPAENNAVQNIVADEQTQLNNDEQEESEDYAERLNNEADKSGSADGYNSGRIEDGETEDTVSDDDFIESPPHEPLSGHEGDAEPTVTRTQKRRTIAERNKSNVSSEYEASCTPKGAIGANVQDISRVSEDGRRLRTTRQQTEKSFEYMHVSDLTNSQTEATKGECEENQSKLPQKTLTPRINPRKSKKPKKSTEKLNEAEASTTYVLTAEPLIASNVSNDELTTEQRLYESSQPTRDLATPTENLIDTPPKQHLDQSDGAFVEETPNKTGSSRKRRGGIKITPRRNASAIQMSLESRKSAYSIDNDEWEQGAKSRKIESNYADASVVGVPSAANEVENSTTGLAHSVQDHSGSSNSCNEIISQPQPTVENSEQQPDLNYDTRVQSQLQLPTNAETNSLVIGNDQIVVDPVYQQHYHHQQSTEIPAYNDATTTIEDSVVEEESVNTESPSFHSDDVSNADDLVAYSPVEDQQPVEGVLQQEEMLVDGGHIVEAAANNEPNLNNSPHVIDVTLNQQLDSTYDYQPKADNSANASPMEKVRINVDVANPLSTQIANILGTKSATGATSTNAKRKSNIEEAIPTFVIERSGQGKPQSQQKHTASSLDFTGEQDAVAHVQQMCPNVEITRKEKLIDAPTDDNVEQQQDTNSNVMFDISNMPIVLGNEHFMAAQGDMQIVLTSSTETEPHLRTDGQQILQQQIFQSPYNTQNLQQGKLSTNQQPQQLTQQQQQQPGLIIIKAAPGDLIIQQTQPQSQAIDSGTTQQMLHTATHANAKYNLGSGVTLLPIAEPKLKQQQREQQEKLQQQLALAKKQLSPAAAATGGRKQIGNTITLPSSITVQQRQRKLSDGLANAPSATTTLSTPTLSAQEQASSSKSAIAASRVQKRAHSTNIRRTQLQKIQQRRLTATYTNLMELQQQEQRRSEARAQLQRRLSYSEVYTPPPNKIFRNTFLAGSIFDTHTQQIYAATAEQQLVQLQQQQQCQIVQSPSISQPPPLHPLPNRKSRHGVQKLRRLSAKPDPSCAQNVIQEVQQQQQQLQQQLQPQLQTAQFVLLNQPQHLTLVDAQHLQEQQVATVHMPTELVAPPSAADIIPAEYEAIDLQEQQPQVYTEEILAEAFEANELPPSSVMAVPSQPVPGYPDTLLLCRRVDDEWLPVVAQPYFFTHSDQQLRPIPKEVLIGLPILTPNADKTVEAPTNDSYKGETGVTILIGNEYVHMEWDQFLEVMRSNDDLFDLRDDQGRIFQLTRDALLTLQNDADLQEKYRQLQQLLEEQQLEEQQQLEQQQLLQQHLLQQLQTVTVSAENVMPMVTDVIPFLQIDTSQTLQLIGTEDGSIILQPTLAQPPLSPPCTRPALTNATNALLNQTPIMSPLEKPSTAAAAATLITDSTGQHLNLATTATPDHLTAAGFIAVNDANALTATRPTLGDSLAVIGVVPSQPTLLPPTVTNPAIAPPKTDLIPDMTTAAQMHAQYRHAQRAIYNDPGS
ncbi:uncharacterized protein [Eurosta solidaginis]|uniref:uncharacterized protein isoform X2 n=1 Tax=Eurosta solidaginis TaxID=178769 RepID=UPI003530FF20